MASEQAVLDLGAIIEDCITSKIKAGYDASAALTVDIARQVATEVEAKAQDYTDEEIAKIKQLIGGGEELTPILELLNLIKDLLDGDDDTSNGFDTFNKLVSDTLDNKNTLVNHTTTLSLIQKQLQDLTASIEANTKTLVDHDARLKKLEELDHTKLECEECHDGILAVVGEAISGVCESVGETIANYTTANNAITVKNFADELDPVVIEGSASVNETGIVSVDAKKVSGRRVKSMALSITNSSAIPEVFAVGTNGEVKVTLQTASFNSAESVVAQGLGVDGKEVGGKFIIPTTYPVPPVTVDPIEPVIDPEPVVIEVDPVPIPVAEDVDTQVGNVDVQADGEPPVAS
jgi:hypothetical protein